MRRVVGDFFWLAPLTVAFAWTMGCGDGDATTGTTSSSGGGADGGGGASSSSSSGTGGGGTGGSGGASSSGTGGVGGEGGGGTPGPHDIGGTVLGLLGSGLVLQNNGGDDLAIAADGPFAFPTPLANGATYEVTVSVPPTAPQQDCVVQDGQGTVAGYPVTDVLVSCSLIDSDTDGIPDLADPFPNDGTIPTTALSQRVYPHTSSQLFTMDVNNYTIAPVGSFHGSGYSGSMTDVAIDQYGVLYGVTFNDLYVCNATNAECFHLAALPQSFNGMTAVPPGTLHPFLDTLVAIAISGDWYRMELVGPGQAQLTNIGAYGQGYTSSGDAFSIHGVGTYAAVNKPGQSADYIISVDPTNGNFIAELGPVLTYSTVYGLAGWLNEVYCFDSSGAVILVDINNSTPTLLQQTNHSWWGAGVSTRL